MNFVNATILDSKNNYGNKPFIHSEFINSIGMKFLKIPAGIFTMGIDNKIKTMTEFEKPNHIVRITKPFYISETTFTLEHFCNLFEKSFSLATSSKGLPLTNISWNEIQQILNVLNSKENVCSETNYRLPTEAEWEYSCIANESHPCFSEFDECINIVSLESSDKLNLANSLSKNSFGLKGMLGNVWEFCSDYFDEKYYSYSPNVDPKGPEFGKFRVARGGSYLNNLKECRGTARNHFLPDSRFPNLGFRLVKMT